MLEEHRNVEEVIRLDDHAGLEELGGALPALTVAAPDRVYVAALPAIELVSFEELAQLCVHGSRSACRRA